jgi:hypothetical protein
MERETALDAGVVIHLPRTVNRIAAGIPESQKHDPRQCIHCSSEVSITAYLNPLEN